MMALIPMLEFFETGNGFRVAFAVRRVVRTRRHGLIMVHRMHERRSRFSQIPHVVYIAYVHRISAQVATMINRI